MASRSGIIALMGSGELTGTMVEVHKQLLGDLTAPVRAVFLDTPAGFQLNVDQLSQKVLEYFSSHVQHSMSVASYKSCERTTPFEAEQAFRTLREADFVLIGPGSPTYALRQWQKTPIPEILLKRIETGAVLIAASAAALTVGRFTLPVYEIYKVGNELHWAEGMNILGHFGFNLVVIPHWNNAEGGTHDTRFCYMGESRFKELESLLPKDVSIFGLDEHTACLINLEQNQALIKGIGRVTLRSGGNEMTFKQGDRIPLDVLRRGQMAKQWKVDAGEPPKPVAPPDGEEESFWDRVHAAEKAFGVGLENDDPRETTNALLELDRTIWQAQQDLENEEFISQAREILRELIVLIGTRLELSPKDRTDCLAPLVQELMRLREKFRRKKQWQEADAIRDSLKRAEIVLEDTKDGPKWRLGS
ncbi:MAG: type 1 glutamine amidotransferase-like domain-containing protein [Proteobacteria bacterium]|nr:type 1 glutamine amidotransferase-like domain-containing protein [Pseudomonadota bacterium]